MSTKITLENPNNASNPVALEQLIARNNAAIILAFEGVLSRFKVEGNNFLQTNLDLNGHSLINVGDSPFLKTSDLPELTIGELRINPSSMNLEYRAPGSTSFVVLYTLNQLRGPTGASGNGTGDLISTNNLSDVGDPAEARENLELTVGEDVQEYSPVLDDLATGTLDFAASDDPRFVAYPVDRPSQDTLTDTRGTLFIPTISVTLTVPTSAEGVVYSVYCQPDIVDGLTLIPTGVVNLYQNGSTVPSDELFIAPGTIATIICTSADGNSYITTGTSTQ